MTNPDVVAELDAWLDHVDVARVMGKDMAQRARDEIVALREWKEAALRSVLPVTFRADVLEEAAQVVEARSTEFWDGQHLVRDPNLLHRDLSGIAAAIRALKDKP